MVSSNQCSLMQSESAYYTIYLCSYIFFYVDIERFFSLTLLTPPPRAQLYVCLSGGLQKLKNVYV